MRLTADLVLQLPPKSPALSAPKLTGAGDFLQLHRLADLHGVMPELGRALVTGVSRPCDFHVGLELALDGQSVTHFDTTCACYFSDQFQAVRCIEQVTDGECLMPMLGSSENLSLTRFGDEIELGYLPGPPVGRCALAELQAHYARCDREVRAFVEALRPHVSQSPPMLEALAKLLP